MLHTRSNEGVLGGSIVTRDQLNRNIRLTETHRVTFRKMKMSWQHSGIQLVVHCNTDARQKFRVEKDENGLAAILNSTNRTLLHCLPTKIQNREKMF